MHDPHPMLLLVRPLAYEGKQVVALPLKNAVPAALRR